MIESPNIIGPLDFYGLKNNIIFVKHDEEDDAIKLISLALEGPMIILTPFPETINTRTPSHINPHEIAIKETTNIADLHKMVKVISKENEESPIRFYIVDGIDHFNVSLGKRVRGSVIKSNLSMLASPRLLRGSNIVVTSTSNEYSIESIADKTIKLTKPCH